MTVFRLYYKDKPELDVRPEDVKSIDNGKYRMTVEVGDAKYYAHRIEKVERSEDDAVPLQS